MFRVLVVLLLAAASGAAEAGEEWRDLAGPKAVAIPGASVEAHVMPDGRRVPTPEIATLDCDEMKAVLHEIDMSGYRGTEPLPEGDPNMPLFDYENRLATAYFGRCAGAPGLPEDPASAFTGGFKAN